MSVFDTDIRFVKGIGEKKAKLFAKLGIFSLADLLNHFPREYEDRREIKRLCDVLPGDSVCVEASLTGIPRHSRPRAGMELLKFAISDGSVLCDVTIFNQSWQKDRLKTGETYIFYGKFGGTEQRLNLINPVFEFESRAEKSNLVGRILPIYRLSAGVGRQSISNAVGEALIRADGEFTEPLPAWILTRFSLRPPQFCYQNIHFPNDDIALYDARKRLVFEELFLLALGLRLMRSPVEAAGFKLKPLATTGFTKLLPFTLTGAQSRAISEIFTDLSSGCPMNRLVQGDVGSGKTVVAAAAIWLAGKSGLQAAFMAPTELLATQHYRSLLPIFEAVGLRIELLTGSMPATKKSEIQEKIGAGELDVVIGTHALITDKVKFQKLGLVITDEQHRFGVNQRAALAEKGNIIPHVLVMSATPIPRTLALIMYGDLDISIIDELPPGRTPIDTFAVGENYRARLNRFVRKLVGEGRQIYIVCPLVSDIEGLDDGRKAVEEYAEKLRTQTFPDLRVALIHGKLPQKKKDEIMHEYGAAKIDILVSTTVIEVGIDVPNAALMIVENAERFGLSQLHQLRGRVGRGKHKSYCILVSSSSGEATRERLRVMCETNDGFKIAEADLNLRGPGDFFGSRQHGLPFLKIADLAADSEPLRLAALAADETLAADPKLTADKHSILREKITAMFEKSNFN